MFNKFLLAVTTTLALLICSTTSAAEATWKAGTAKAVITPEKSMWMAGYGGRDHTAEATLHDLYIRVVALEDANGHKAVILSSDTLGISQSIYNNTCATLKKELGLERAQIMLNSSHTHCGPVLRGALYDTYPLKAEHIKQIEEYSNVLEEKIITTIKQAFNSMESVRLYAGKGITRFGVNRRNNREADVPAIRAKNELKGPIDHSVPVLAIRSLDGKLKGVVFGYACHNTTLSFYKWCGDYAGFAQYALEASHPGAVALFAMGCGADQNPIPRRFEYLAQRYGNMLASSVEEVLLQPMNSLKPKLQTELEMIDLKLGAAPTQEELEPMAAAKPNYKQRWAARLLKQLKAGQPFFRTYPYPVQAWKLDNQLWITLGGEVVVDYSLGFKKAFGDKTWVTGYCNDVMCYIPSLRVLEEGGYEGQSSMMVYGMPCHRWHVDIEKDINASVHRLVKKLNAGK